VDGNGSRPCPMAGVGISSVGYASFATIELVKGIIHPDVTKSLRKKSVTCVIF
jgi:hypothetical protein